MATTSKHLSHPLRTLIVFLAFCVGLVGLMAVSLNRKHLPRLTAFLAKIMPHRLADRVTTLLGNFSSGADVLHRPAGFLAVVALSALTVAFARLGAMRVMREG